MSTDHVKEARKWIGIVEGSRPGQESAEAVGMAQAHAALAIAAELRTANFLALARHPETDPERAGAAWTVAAQELKGH